MKIKILGNGGALNDGLPYNAFIIDKKILVEMPPDIMVSLFREKIDIPAIDEIYISHLHGDHCFGFPFFALRLQKTQAEFQRKNKIKLYVPKKGKEHLIGLTEKAMSVGNPTIEWVKKYIEFIEISLSVRPEIPLQNYTAELFRMDHQEETYGFVLKDGTKKLLAYTADTKWSHNIESILKEKAKAVIIDLNGEPGDAKPIHVNEQELIDKGIRLAGTKTIFYGTHLKYVKKSRHPMLKYAEPGMEIDL